MPVSISERVRWVETFSNVTSPDTHEALDSLAERYVREKDPEEAERLLGELISGHCGPLIRKIIGHRLGGSNDSVQDIDDVCGNAQLDLLERIEDVRSGAAETVESFSRYTAVVAYHACHDHFRSKFPQRHRLKSRLRYLLKPERGFDLWESARGDWVCGWRKWRDTGAALSPRPAVLPLDAAGLPPPGLLASIFDHAQGPVEFDALVDLVAEFWAVDDQPVQEAAPSPSLPIVDEAAQRRRLERLWREIGELPRRQRVALLLNLRAQDEKCALELFTLTGIASMRQIAALLEIEIGEFAVMWTKLPLDDLSIAALLDVTRQQVINLRKSARKRLERRMYEVIQDLRSRP